MSEESLEAVQQFVVPRDVLDAVHEHLRNAGRLGCEGVGFWAGVIEGQTAIVTASVVPAQRSGDAGGGLAVVIAGDELFRMNVWLHENGLRLLAQIHSHPSDAYHSVTDDELAIVTQTGSLSIVVPDFARNVFGVASSAVYRRQPDGGWLELDMKQAEALIRIAD